MITRVTLDSLPRLVNLRQQFLAVYHRPGAPSHEQAATAIVQGQSIGALVNEQAGYFLAHVAPWQGQAVLWIDETYLKQEARKRGTLAEIAAWWKGYCEYNGLSLVVGMVFSLEEGKPFRQHLGAIPACTILQVAVTDLEYRPSLLPVTTHPQVVEAPAEVPPQESLPPARTRKRRPQAKADGSVPSPVVEDYPMGLASERPKNGVQFERHGKFLPLGGRPEEM